MQTPSPSLTADAGRHVRKRYKAAIADHALVWRAVQDAFGKLDPRAGDEPGDLHDRRRLGLVTVLFIRDLATGQPALFSGQIAAWLWFTMRARSSPTGRS